MAFDSNELWVEVVSADGIIWEGDATQVIARTTEGDIGIMANHEPLLAILVPSAAEVFTTDGRREIAAVDGGFLSVSDNRVALISSYGRMSEEISLQEAERELDHAKVALEKGDVSLETKQQYHRAQAQVRAAQKAAAKN